MIMFPIVSSACMSAFAFISHENENEYEKLRSFNVSNLRAMSIFYCGTKTMFNIMGLLTEPHSVF